MNRLLLVVMLALCVPLWAEDSVPGGTILPVALNTTLNTRKIKPGQTITATVMQDVPAAGSLKIRARSRLLGHVVAAAPATANSGASLTIQFDTLVVSKRRLPVATDLRAMASMMDVYEAQIPAMGADRGTSENAWTTTQIGGQVVYRGGGPLAEGLRSVGQPVPNGVLARTSARPGTHCRADIDNNDQPQALWVFSSDACGLYGIPGASLVHSGRGEPVGQITLASQKGNFDLRSGSGLLLRVITPPTRTAQD